MIGISFSKGHDPRPDDYLNLQNTKAIHEFSIVLMTILDRSVRSADLNATKNVFMGAVRFATTIEEPCLSFGDELKISAQEQVDYMRREDADTSLVTSSEEVVSKVRKGLLKLSSAFEKEVSLLLLEPGLLPDIAEKKNTGMFDGSRVDVECTSEDGFVIKSSSTSSTITLFA
ncbi:hypothetical protein QQ045_016996 [Rhodiola kirilowii]